MKNCCYICKFEEVRNPKANVDIIFDSEGNSRALPLCYGHSVELFKSGQRSFLDKHREKYRCDFVSDLEVVFSNSDNRDRSWF